MKNKPLLIIDGLPIIIHSLKRSLLAKKLDKVIVCTDDKRIVNVVDKHGGQAVLTSKKHKNHKQNIKGEETHFVITLKSHKFSKLTIIERQRYIINILGDEVIKNVHSISFKLSLPKDKNINLLKE